MIKNEDEIAQQRAEKVKERGWSC